MFSATILDLATPAVALAVHLYSKRHEPASVLDIVTILLVVPAGLSVLLFQQGYYSGIVQSILFTTLTYLTTLSGSIIAYRLSPIHPLAKYPGPTMGKVTRLWELYKVLGGKKRIYHQKLHEKYGDVVRTGPNHLHIRNVNAISIVHGPGSAQHRWVRNSRYEVAKIKGSTGSLLSIVSTTEHSQRRRIWDRAFTPTALKEYEPLIQQRALQLVTGLRRQEQKTVDLGSWLSYFSMDFMGDLAFASEFGFLERGEDYLNLQHTLEMGIRIQETFGTIPWTRSLIASLRTPAMLQNLRDTARHHIDKRKNGGSARRDLFYHLLDEDGSNEHEPLPKPTIIMEAILVLVAGSDTTAITLSNIFYYLLTNPEVFDRLRNEIDKNVPGDIDCPDLAMVSELPFLQAVINETLRLKPVVPDGPQRTPPGETPVFIDDILIPPHTAVQVSTWSIHRDPRYFWPHPDSFYPDRWLVNSDEVSSEDFQLNKLAWIPFSFGPMNCVGKQLALNEMKLVVATLVRSCDFKLAPGWNPQEWEDDLTDSFLLFKGKLPAIVTMRKM